MFASVGRRSSADRLARGAERQGEIQRRVASRRALETPLSILIRFAPASLTADQYDAAVQRLYDDGVLPADGLEYEICFGSGSNMRVSQVWDTQAHLDAFGARLMPILAELGIDPGAPEIAEVHNVIKG